jgi:hypothetical protein
MTSARWLRVRALLDRQFAVVVLALLVVAGTGGYLAFDAYAGSNTTVRTTEVTLWEADGSFTHRATVVDNESRAGPFEPGAVVTNRSVYFQPVMPVLNGTFRYGYVADAGELTATVRPRLVIRSVGESGENRIEYWRLTRSLETHEATLAPGERGQAPFAVNVTDAAATADRVHERVGDPGRTQMSVNVSVALSGTAGSQSVDRTLRYALPLSVEGDVYRVASSGETRTFTRTERTTVTESPGPLAAYGGPALLALSLLGLVGLASARRDDRLALTDAERAWVTYRDDRADFDDWVAQIRLPAEARSRPVAEADSLADLVNFAIDTDSAVIESPDGDAYHVLHDGIRYTFTRPSPPATAEPDRGDSPTVGADAESALPDGHDDRSTGRTHAAESLGDEGRD